MIRKNLILMASMALFLFLIFFKISSVPISLTNDEVSEVYNSYSILTTGRDRYGMAFPLTFRSLGTYLAPLYTYLTVIPVWLFGLTDLSARLVSLVSGFAIIILTWFITKKQLSVAVLAISPWLIFFSRSSSEVTLALALFLVGVLLALRSLEDQRYFIPATLFFGISTHAYYSEKLIAPLFLLLFVLVFRKKFMKHKKYIFAGFVIFALTQIPNLLVGELALSRRFAQTVDLELYRILARYLAYFSPRNLFFDPDSQGVRSMPELSVFYSWMIIPFAFGLNFIAEVRKSNLWKVVLILLIITPIPAALTREPFYTIRVLIFLWSVSMVISHGISKVGQWIHSKKIIYSLALLFLASSIFSFYLSYFVLFRFERQDGFGYRYLILSKIINQERETKFVVDNSRDPSICLRMAYIKNYNPASFQTEIGARFLGDYFGNFDVGENCQIENVEVHPIIWGQDIYKNQILIGDVLAISPAQVGEHKLKEVFEIIDADGTVLIRGYSTNPKEKCLLSNFTGVYCRGLND